MPKISVKLLVKIYKGSRDTNIYQYLLTLSSASANILGLALLASHMLSDPGSPNEQGGLGHK